MTILNTTTQPTPILVLWVVTTKDGNKVPAD